MKNRKKNNNESPVIRAEAPQGDHWYLVPHKTGSIAIDLMISELKMLGFEYYRPMMQRMGRPMLNGVRPGALQVINEPLFPGYIFVRHDQDRKARINRVYGVSGIALGAVRNEAIEKLKRDEELGWQEVVSAIDPDREDIAVGVDVETKLYGEWVRAVVAERSGPGRVVLLIEFFGRQTRFVVPLAHVVRVRNSDAA